ncbi:MAG: tryptophan--tRNA ligase [Oscillospiraceae bacterium]|nr:tryptophan--tRNA ligase [Oscillospiraceae bacterium]
MENTERRQRVFSGIQPSGNITMGNYMGAITNWVSMQDMYDCLFCVVDMHAITVRQDPKKLREQTLSLLALLIGCGLDPEKNIMYIQSHVRQHAELSWILNCYTMYGELSRMTQFKDKSAKHADNINAGLFDYPVLMAADILLYNADYVPIGEDQKQHLELARNIAQRFNNHHGDVFRIPEPYIPKVGGRIMSLAEPEKKMSKSDTNPNAYVLLMDKPEDIMRKFKRAVTDSEAKVEYREGKAGVNNLITIYSVATGKSVSEIENEFVGKGYGDFKCAVGEAVVELLRPVREKTEDILKNKDYLEEIYKKNAIRASQLAERTLEKVSKKVGFVAKAR